MTKLISVVAPVYFEEDLIEQFYKRLSSALPDDQNYRYEFIFVNDGSTDLSLKILIDLRMKDSRIKLLDLSRNFGHQIAITAGIDHSTGAATVVIDADLQDPPEIIPQMIAKWQEGFDVVYGQRKSRDGESFFKLFSAKWFYRILFRFSDVFIPVDTGDFRLMDRMAVNAFKRLKEQNRFIRGLVSWLGFKQTAVFYERDKRFAGETKYSLGKMLRLAADGLTSFSEKPLYAGLYLGVGLGILALLGICQIIYALIFNPESLVSGWSSIVVVMLLLGSAQLFSFGILGIYVGRIYREVKQRPLYLLSDKIGFDP